MSRPREFNPEHVSALGTALAERIKNNLSDVYKPYLRLSNLSTPCRRKLWYQINTPQKAEPLHGAAKLKFLFGHILEELILFLARAAGHKVEREQEEVSIHGVKGHIDAVVDDHLVDVKSTSTYGFRKFADNALGTDDPFGYLGQLGAYANALNQRSASFIAVDKTLGNLAVDTYEFPPDDIAKKVVETKSILAAKTPPTRLYASIPEGKSGNERLGVECSYCPFKWECWPGLKGYRYAKGPVYLSRIVREPDVPQFKFGEE